MRTYATVGATPLRCLRLGGKAVLSPGARSQSALEFVSGAGSIGTGISDTKSTASPPRVAGEPLDARMHPSRWVLTASQSFVLGGRHRALSLQFSVELGAHEDRERGQELP